MMSWPLKRMGDIAPLVRRPVETQPDDQYYEVGIRSFGKGCFHKPAKTGTELGSKKMFSWSEGDLIFNIVFAWEGAVAVAGPDEEGKVGSHRFLTCVVDPEQADARFLYWWFTSDAGREKLLAASPGGAGRNRTLGTKKLEAMRVPLPPLEEQQRIARRLDRAVELIARRSEAIAAAEAEMKQLLAKAFARCIDGAPCRPMSEVAPLFRRPVEIDPSQQYPELGARSFGRGIFHKPTLNGADLTWQSLFRVEAGDLVFSNIKAWEGAFAVAGPEDHGRFGSHRYLTCVPDARIMSSHFLWYYLQSADGIEQVQAASPGSADRNRTLGQTRLAKIKVPTPPLKTQHWFEALQAKARRIQQLRAESAADIDTLMPSLLDEVFGQRPTAA